MEILHLDSSVLGENSVSRALSGALVEALLRQYPDATVHSRDLDERPIAHLSRNMVQGNDAQAAQENDYLIQQLKQSDILVLGAPMYNFSIPSTLKSWLDRVMKAGETFRYTEQGPVGLLQGKRVFIASARGGQYGDESELDFQERYLRKALGFMGIEDITVVRAEGVALPGQREEALSLAHAHIERLQQVA